MLDLVCSQEKEEEETMTMTMMLLNYTKAKEMGLGEIKCTDVSVNRMYLSKDQGCK